MQNQLSGRLPFYTTIAIVLIATGGISWTHGNVYGALFFILGCLFFILIICSWLRASINSFVENPKLGRSALIWGLVALFMFIFSGVLERGYDVATKDFGVNGKINQHFQSQSNVLNVKQKTNVDLLVHVSKMPIKIIDQSSTSTVNYGSDFEVYFKVKNLQDQPLKIRALVSVIPSTSAPLIKAINDRYPVIDLPAYGESVVVLPLHLTDKVPKHNHNLIIGVGLFNMNINLRR